MKGEGKVLMAIQDLSDSIKRTARPDNLYIERDGEMILVAQAWPEDIESVIKVIKKKKKDLRFTLLFQDAEVDLINKLKTSEYKVFGYIRSKMSFDNRSCFTIDEITESVKMGRHTVISAMKKLMVLKVIIKEGKKGRYEYVVNPVYGFKGHITRIDSVTKKFSGN
jgi:predicted transcriptional regulator